MARYTAKDILIEDPNLEMQKNRNILNTYLEIDRKTGAWANIS
jgi:hypothetical protein